MYLKKLHSSYNHFAWQNGYAVFSIGQSGVDNATKYVTLYSKNAELNKAWELTLHCIDNDAKKALLECFSWKDDYDNVAKPKLSEKVDSEKFYKDLNERIKERERREGKKPVGIRFAPSGVFQISL